MKYIKNGKFILCDSIIENAILAFGNKICGFVDEIPENAEVIDADGATLHRALSTFIFTDIWVRIRLTVTQTVSLKWQMV